MAEIRVTYYERDESAGVLAEVSHEEFDARTAKQAMLAAVESAERWIGPDRRTRTYRIERLLPPD
jgi:hypothetical protein